MAYDIQGFNFNPNKSFSFNPSNNAVKSGISDSPYIPKCGQTSQMKEAYHKYTMQYANQFGMTIRYQPIKYNFNTHNFIYGEDPTSGYNYARRMKAVINFQEYSAFLTKFGFQSNEKLTAYIPIRHFEEIWGPTDNGVYPLDGDIFIIEDSSCDRPLHQSPLVWQVSKDDKTNSTVDFLAGHYTWRLECTRFNYSFEPGVTPERFLVEESRDTEEHGRLAGGENPPEMSPKTDGVDEFTKANFDSTQSGNTSTYGKYL